MNIITRSEWGAMPPKNVRLTTAQEIFLHHSVGSGMIDWNKDGDKGDDYMRSMQRFHMDDRGWDDIAYNFVIDPEGLECYEGRGWGVRPGAQKNYNTNTWAVCIMGDFRTRTSSPALESRIAELVKHGVSLGHIPESAVLQGHKDAPNQSTTCPGTNMYAALPRINTLIKEDDTMTPEQMSELKSYMSAAIAANNIPLVNMAWTRFQVRDAEGNLVTFRSVFETVYRSIVANLPVNAVVELDEQAVADAILSQINLVQSS